MSYYPEPDSHIRDSSIIQSSISQSSIIIIKLYY